MSTFLFCTLGKANGHVRFDLTMGWLRSLFYGMVQIVMRRVVHCINRFLDEAGGPIGVKDGL